MGRGNSREGGGGGDLVLAQRVGKAGVQGQGRQRVPALSLPARGRCQAQRVGAPLGRPGAWRRVRLVRGEGRGVSD